MSKVKVIYDSGDTLGIDDEPDVIDFGSDLLESEDLVDTAYNVFLALIVRKGWEAGTPDIKIDDFGIAYTDGLYLCGVRRSVITHQYDPVNDIVPSEFSVWTGRKGAACFREIQRIPKGWRTAAMGRHFRHTYIDFENDPATCFGDIITLMDDGRIIPAKPSSWGQSTQCVIPGASALTASVSINLYCDRRFLWQVQTRERVLGSRDTPLCIGVSEEHVKSLFYARSLPLTDTGRKRPILHWVRAHQRRLREGIEIDIQRHLRGIEHFEMGGFDWAITNPVKPEPNRKAA